MSKYLNIWNQPGNFYIMFFLWLWQTRIIFLDFIYFFLYFLIIANMFDICILNLLTSRWEMTTFPKKLHFVNNKNLCKLFNIFSQLWNFFLSTIEYFLLFAVSQKYCFLQRTIRCNIYCVHSYETCRMNNRTSENGN